MGWFGLPLEIPVLYLLMQVVRIFRFFRSIRWKRTRFPISRTEVIEPGMGCPWVQVYYRRGPKEYQEECDEVPFLMRQSAKNYANKILANQRAIVRMNPANETETMFFEFDQQ